MNQTDLWGVIVVAGIRGIAPARFRCRIRLVPDWVVIRGTFLWGTNWAGKRRLGKTENWGKRKIGKRENRTHRGVDFFRCCSLKCCFFFSLILRYLDTSNFCVFTFLCRFLEWLCPIDHQHSILFDPFCCWFEGYVPLKGTQSRFTLFLHRWISIWTKTELDSLCWRWKKHINESRWIMYACFCFCWILDNSLWLAMIYSCIVRVKFNGAY